jgi:SAM-dependent MidA family methyltransferase
VWKKSEASADLRVFMVETSPFMRRTQLKILCGIDEQEPVSLTEYKSKHSESIRVVWLHDLNELPVLEAPQFFLANEFFDALPCHKFQVNYETAYVLGVF